MRNLGPCPKGFAALVWGPLVTVDAQSDQPWDELWRRTEAMLVARTLTQRES